jgi:predicted nucleotidyltransferase
MSGKRTQDEQVVARRPAGYACPRAEGIDSEPVARLERRLRNVLAPESTVRWAYLFGSAARGNAFRDLDVAVMLASHARGAVALGRIASRAEEAGDGFRRLADAGILERDLAERLAAWAGFRNVLAHFYASVDSTAPTTPSASSATSNASPPSWRHESIRGDAWVSLAKNVTATLGLAPQPPETISHLVA